MKKRGMFLLMLILIFALAACGTSDKTSSKKDDKNNENEFNLVQPGELVVVSLGELKPFSYMEGDKIVGYDVDVGEAIAEKLGLEFKPTRAKLSGIITGVQTHRYDIGVASLTITDERKKEVDFSQPYYYSGPGIYTRPGSDIKSAEDLHGKEISIARGSSYISIGEKYTDNIPQVDNDVIALQALGQGHHDAVITDVVIGDAAINNGLEIEKQELLEHAEQAAVVAKDNPKLLEAVNKALDELKEEGVLKELSMKWHGVDITEPMEQ